MEELINLKQIIFSFYGGPKKFDCWLNKTADQIIFEGPPVGELHHTLTPFLSWINKPREVIDFILERFESIGLWEYRIEENCDVIDVIDVISGRTIETVQKNDSNLEILKAKYGTFSHPQYQN